MSFLEGFMNELVKIAQATAIERMQASQKAMNKLTSNIQSGNLFKTVQRAKPIAPTNPAITPPPGAANIKPSGFTRYDPFGKQTAKTLGIP